MDGPQSPGGVNACPDESFPARGLVDLSRATYQNTPLAIAEIRPKVFTLFWSLGTVTAVGTSEGCAIIDTGYGPRVDEIRRGIPQTLRQPPRWLINTHWHFDHTDGNTTLLRVEQVLSHTPIAAPACLETSLFPLSNGRSQPLHAPHGPW